MPKIVIVIEGGVFADICVDAPVEVVVVDHDKLLDINDSHVNEITDQFGKKFLASIRRIDAEEIGTNEKAVVSHYFKEEKRVNTDEDGNAK